MFPMPYTCSVTYLGVPNAEFVSDSSGGRYSKRGRITIFEHRPHLADRVVADADPNTVIVIADRPMTARRLPAGSQHRILVSSPLYLAQFDGADRKRMLTCCAKWLHPSQGVLVLQFLDGDAGTRAWCTRKDVGHGLYNCEATIEPLVRHRPPTAVDDHSVCHLRERIHGADPCHCCRSSMRFAPAEDNMAGAARNYSSLVFASPAAVWRAIVKLAGLVIVHEEAPPADAEDGSSSVVSIVTWICRPSS